MQLNELEQWFNTTLDHAQWAGHDKSLNGLQVSRQNSTIQRVAFAVDASLQAFERAVEAQADLLVVHHGLFWGTPLAVTNSHYQRLRFLMNHDLALFASHLPLDAHAEVGNNVGMAKALSLNDIEPFGDYHGRKIGFRGRLAEPTTLESVMNRVFRGRDSVLQILPFGPTTIQTVGIISGGAPYEVSQAIDQKLDLYITGDASHSIYHTALEAGIHVICGGHYATETWGVRLLAQKLQKETGLVSLFLDLPTGL